MLTRTHWCVLGCMIVQAGWLAAAAQSPGQAVLPPIAERAPEPLASPAQPASAEWLAPYVGHFESGGGFTGVALEIRPDGGFDWVDWGCTDQLRSTGQVFNEGGDLLLQSRTVTDERRSQETRPSERVIGPLVPVPWDERLYLVGRDQADVFCNFVNAGIEPAGAESHGGRFLSRVKDFERDASGLPDVPAAWRGLLLHEPVAGHVVSIEPDGRALIDLGSDDGLFAGVFLGQHFQPNADWAVPQQHVWYFSSHLIVEEVRADSCLARASGDWAKPRAGQLVTGGIPASPPLPLELWRSTASDPHLSIPPLAPLPGSSQADLDRWTAQIRDTFSPGVSIAEPLSPELLDALTPAFFNAMQGLDMSDGDDIRRASAILDVWHGYQARCSTKRLVRIEFDGDPGWDPDARTADRIWQVETFAMWWRDMSADPQRLADFRRGKSP